MKSFIKNQKGNVIAFSALITFVLIGFASISIDVGAILSAKNQLQSAVDASALAGATGLFDDYDTAVQLAMDIGSRNECFGQTIELTVDDITFPAGSRIAVQSNQTVPLFFAKVLGLESAQISASAMAEIGTIVSTNRMRPWAVPDNHYDPGDRVVIKSGSLGAPSTVPSFYYPIDFPALNRGTPLTGACIYEQYVKKGAPDMVFMGDELQVEPGNMVGPTKQGIEYLLNKDQGAYWDGNNVVNSSYPGTSSPRIIKIPLFDPNDPPTSGRNSIIVTGFAAFFVQGMQGKDVIGVFMNKVTGGYFGSGNSMLRGVRLVG